MDPRKPCRPRRLSGRQGGASFRSHHQRAAEFLGADEELLRDLVTNMDPEDGCHWIYGTGDEQTIAFTPAGMEYLHELLAEHKRSGLSPRS